MSTSMDKLTEAAAHFKRGEADLALDAIEVILENKPGQLDALVLAGQIQHSQGNYKKAVFYLERALTQLPGHVVLISNLAAAHLALGDPVIAESLARPAVLSHPDHFGVRLNLGLALFAQRRYKSSADELTEALKLRPGSLVALKNLAHALKRSQQSYFKTRAMLEDVLVLSPGEPETLAMLADSHIQNAAIDTGLELFEELLGSAMDIPSNDASRYHDSYLLALQYRQQTTLKDLYEASIQWADRYCRSRGDKPVAHGGSKLRIGWVSPRFSDGPVACFLLAVLKAFDRSRSEHYLYATRLHEGSINNSFKLASDSWRDLDGQPADVVARLMDEDKLDVLVDLAGHSPGGMLTSLCQRHASVQISWLDSFCTTGVENIDAFLSDWYLSPSGDEEYFTESLLRIKPGRVCYRPQQPVASAPRTPGADGLVFASFNRLSKLGDEVLLAWAGILAALPGSRLVLRNTMFDDAGVRESFCRRGETLGLNSERLSLLGYCGYSEIMASYADIDIVLDPFPFSGCTTTCDALWMGVPVITRTGSTLVSRQSGAILDALGLDEFIADSTQAYIACAVKLAGDESRRTELRSSLREKMTTVFDPQEFAAILLNKFQQLATSTGIPGA